MPFHEFRIKQSTVPINLTQEEIESLKYCAEVLAGNNQSVKMTNTNVSFGKQGGQFNEQVNWNNT